MMKEVWNGLVLCSWVFKQHKAKQNNSFFPFVEVASVFDFVSQNRIKDWVTSNLV